MFDHPNQEMIYSNLPIQGSTAQMHVVLDRSDKVVIGLILLVTNFPTM